MPLFSLGDWEADAASRFLREANRLAYDGGINKHPIEFATNGIFPMATELPRV